MAFDAQHDRSSQWSCCGLRGARCAMAGGSTPPIPRSPVRWNSSVGRLLQGRVSEECWGDGCLPAAVVCPRGELVLYFLPILLCPAIPDVGARCGCSPADIDTLVVWVSESGRRVDIDTLVRVAIVWCSSGKLVRAYAPGASYSPGDRIWYQGRAGSGCGGSASR